MEGLISPRIIVITTIIILSLLIPSSYSASDSLLAGESISGNDTLVSANNNYALGFFSPGNSNRWYLGIWLKIVDGQVVVWVANREAPITGSFRNLTLTNDGNLVLTNGTSATVWSTGAGNLNNPVARMTEKGNFILTDRNMGSDTYYWQSFDHPTDTLLPDMKIGVNIRTGNSTKLVAWRSDDDPAPGTYSLGVDVKGIPQLILYNGWNPIWRVGPWTGKYWSQNPQITQASMLNFSFSSNKDEAYYTFHIIQDLDIFPSLIVNGSTGQIALRLVSNRGSQSWGAPNEKCSHYNQCGSYAVCGRRTTASNCACIEGFEVNTTDPSSNDCVRKVPLDCRGGKDSFTRMERVKLPDTRIAVKVENKMSSIEECRKTCLANCSCTAYANAYSDNTGCLMWFGDLVDVTTQAQGSQDVYVRVGPSSVGSPKPSENLQKPTKKSRTTLIVAAICVLVGMLLLTSLGCFVWRRKKPRNAGDDLQEDLDLPIIEFATLATATRNFSDENKLGEGGFGPVYKGTLVNGQVVAVKRLSKCSTQGLKEFKNEVLLIAKLQHRNLVRLLGCCIHRDERMLIYEYMSNKSLDGFLFGKANGEGLDWQTRYRIITGIARGLLYLHQDSRLRIVHRDLKAGNILLDEDMNPKISDFGTARIFRGDDTGTNNTLRVVGTYGYMSPEYALDGIFSVKSDVFSFGVLLLEIISGVKNKAIFQANPQENLIGHTWMLWEDDKGVELIDPLMVRPFDETEVLKCIKIGLLCVQEQPDDRPSMSSVVRILGDDIESIPDPKQPGYVTIRVPLESDTSSSANAISSSINDVSITMFEGR